MTRSRFLVLLAVAVAAAVTTVVVLRDDARVIRKQLATLVELASVSGREPPLKQVNRGREILLRFTADVSVELSGHDGAELTLQGRQALGEALVAARAQAGPLELRLAEVRFEEKPARGRAVTRVQVVARRGVDEQAYVGTVRLRWRKDDGSWRIARVEAVAADGEDGSH
jgi:hypothetical protein